MSTSCKARITGYYGGQALALGLILLALHFPAGAQTRGAIPIAFGQTVQGTLTSTDRLLEDGTPYDTYIFTVPAPGQPYFINASSPDIPLTAALFRLVPGGGFIDQQAASVFTRGQTVGFFGVLNQAGRYGIDVFSADPQQPTGPSGTASYTLSLTNTPPLAALPAQ
jgi:hypothetical protein